MPHATAPSPRQLQRLAVSFLAVWALAATAAVGWLLLCPPDPAPPRPRLTPPSTPPPGLPAGPARQTEVRSAAACPACPACPEVPNLAVDPRTARARQSLAGETGARLRARCDQGSPVECSFLGALSLQAAEPVEARRALSRSCQSLERPDAGTPAAIEEAALACLELGRLLSQGQGGPQDLEGARRALELACQRQPRNCHPLGALLEEEDLDREAMVTAFEKACRAGIAKACFALGSLYHHGEKLPADPAAAKAWWDAACTLSDVVGCVAMAEEGDPSSAAKYWARACALGSEPSCAKARETPAR